MKRLLTILTMVMMTLAAIAQTSTITMNGITYELYDATMTATIKDGGCSGIVYVDETFRMMQNSYTVTAVADNAFMGNSSITEVMLPNTVKTIGASAFDGCTSLQRINIPRNLESIGSDAFDRCEALQPIQLIQADPGVIPSDDDLQQAMTHWLSIRFGSDRANPLFYAHRLTGMSEDDIITEVNIPESITEIYAWAFAGGQDITTVNFPSPADEAKALSKAKSADDQEFKIGYGAFYGCEKLVISKLPASVKEIKPSTFEGCRSIVEFNVHEGIRAVGSRAFAGCIGLKDFFCLTSYVPEAQGDTFEDSSISSATLHIYSRLLDKFKEAEGWKDFGSFETVLSDEEKEELLATDFLAMTAMDGDVKVGLSNYVGVPGQEGVFVQTSFDKLAWSAPVQFDIYNPVELVTIPSGKTVYFRRYIDKRYEFEESMYHVGFTMEGDGKIILSGNVMSMVNVDCKSDKLVESGTFTNLFRACHNIVSASALKLPAKELTVSCYEEMFLGCTNLVDIPELPATELAAGCYNAMFRWCKSLTTLPSGLLPATTLAGYCYCRMFQECTGLQDLPSGLLPATTLAEDCYDHMFAGCTGLQDLPSDILPATTLVDRCYYYMFNECTSLNALTIKAEDYDNTSNGYYDFSCAMQVLNCLKDTKSPFTLTCPQTLINKKGIAQIKKDFGLGEEDIIEAYLTEEEKAELLATDFFAMTAVDGDMKVGIVTRGDPESFSLQVSSDKLTWDAPVYLDGSIGNFTTQAITNIPAGNTIYFRRYGETDTDLGVVINEERFSVSCWEFDILPANGNAKIDLSGNIMSLLDSKCESTTMSKYAFYGLFSGCEAIRNAKDLKLEATLAPGCYQDMFFDCTSMITTPELPATTLAEYCYRNMFEKCTSLTTVPELPATTLAKECYYNMFGRCASLTTAPELPATTLAEKCYYNMFKGCTNFSSLTIKAEDYNRTSIVQDCLKNTKHVFTLICPQALIDKKGMAQIKEDFGLLPDDNIVALEVIESAILDDENHTATLTQGTRGRNGDSSAIRLTFPDKITVDGQDYEVVAIAPEAFDDLEGVKEIVIECSRVPEIAPDAFDGKDVSGITLFVPEELVDDYRNTEPWARFWPNIIPIREHVTTPQGEFIINNVDETADMISGGRPEDRPTVIVIPATVEHDGRTYPVTKVEPEVFADLSGIEEIFIHAEIVPYLDPHALDDKDLSGIILYVPDDLVEEYQNTYPWSLFPDIRPISEAGIETVTVGSAPVNMKYIENRRIVIRHNGKKYSVQGTLLR